MSCFKNVSIKYLDIFGDKITFNINKDSIHKTKTGGIFSIFFLLIVFLMSLFMGRNFYLRLNPNVLEQNIRLDNHVVRQLKPKNFTIAFRLEDLDGNEVMFKEYIYFRAMLIQLKLNETNNNYEVRTPNWLIEVKRCDSKEFEFIDINGMNKTKFQCLDFTPFEKDLTIGGDYYESPTISFISLEMTVCPDRYFNKTECTDFTKLKKFINDGIILNMLFNQINFNYDNPNPIKNYFYSYSVTIDPRLGKYFTMYYRYGNLTDDKGILWPEKNVEEFVSYESFLYDYSFIEKEDYENPKAPVRLFSSLITLSKNVIISKRTYMKIQDLLAIIGGFISIVKLSLSIIYSFFYRFEIKKLLINKFWEQALKDSNLYITMNNNNNNQLSSNRGTNADKTNKVLVINNEINSKNKNANYASLQKKGQNLELSNLNNTYNTSNNINNLDNSKNISEIVNFNAKNSALKSPKGPSNMMEAQNDHSVNADKSSFVCLDLSERNKILNKSNLAEMNLNSSTYSPEMKKHGMDIDSGNTSNNLNNGFNEIGNSNSNEINTNQIADFVVDQKMGYLKEKGYLDNEQIKENFKHKFSYFYYLCNLIFNKKKKESIISIEIFEKFEDSFLQPFDIFEYLKLHLKINKHRQKIKQ